MLLIARMTEAGADPKPTYTELLRKGQRLEAASVVPGGQPELMIDYAPWSTYQHRDDDLTTYQRALVVVGVGSSGVPVASHAIYLRERRYNQDTKRFEANDPDLAATWNPDGTLELAGTTKQLDALDPSLGAGLRGKHAITFL